MLCLHKLIRFFLIFGIIVCTVNQSYSQEDDLIVGKKGTTPNAATYDLSDPTGVNIQVSVWGFVKFPGRYKVPYNTTFLDIISYAGGPAEDSNLEDIRILRTGNDSLLSKNEIIKLNYDDLLWGEKITSSKKMNPVLKSGDLIIIRKEKRYSLREDISFYLPIITSLLTIATFIVTISRQ